MDNREYDPSYYTQPGPYTPPPNPPRPRKRPGPFKVIGTVIGGALGLILLLGVIAAITTPATTAELPTEVTSKAGQVTPPLPPATSSEPKKPATKKWVPLVKLTGSAEKASDTITTTGGRIKLVYSVKGTEFVFCSFYLLEEGHDLDAEGGFPSVTVNKAARDSTILRKAAGQYYVQARASNARYEITVMEER